MSTEEVNLLTVGSRVNTMNLPLLAYSVPKTQDIPSMTSQILHVLKNYREPIFTYLINIDPSVEDFYLAKIITNNYYKGTDHVFNALIARLLGKSDDAVKYYQQAYLSNRMDQAAKSFLDAYFNPLLIPSPKTPFELTKNAEIFYQKTEYDIAISLLKKAIEIDGGYSPAYFALGINYEMIGKLEIARQMYEKTLQLQPNLENVKKRLARVEKILNKQNELVQ